MEDINNRGNWIQFTIWKGFPGNSEGKESACRERDSDSVPGLVRSLGEGNGYPFQYSSLGDSMDRGAWKATVCGVTKSQARLSDYHFHFYFIIWKLYHLCNLCVNLKTVLK